MRVWPVPTAGILDTIVRYSARSHRLTTDDHGGARCMDCGATAHAFYRGDETEVTLDITAALVLACDGGGYGVPLTIRAYNADPVETETLTMVVPALWHGRIVAIAETGATVPGPQYRQDVVDALARMDAACAAGYSAAAYDHLLSAERAAGTVTETSQS